MNTKIFLMLSLTISAFVYGAAYDTYRLESQEIKGKNRICYYENVRGEGYTVTQLKAKQCKRYLKFNLN